jgi:putative DNA primase/helicase
MTNDPADANVIEINSQRPPVFTDEALALRFASRYALKLRYVASSSRWFIYTGKQWIADETLYAFDMARLLCREASDECNKPKIASMLASAKTVAAIERLARADRRMAATMDQFDVDPMLLNTPDGVVDLCTGKMREHRANDYLTRMTAVAPSGACPTWREFLNRVAAGDVDLQSFLQRKAGYSLTGITREHALFFLFGLGANGKSVYTNTLSGIMAIITARRRSRPLPLRTSTGIRPILRAYAVQDWLPRSRPRRAGGGLKAGSSR